MRSNAAVLVVLALYAGLTFGTAPAHAAFPDREISLRALGQSDLILDENSSRVVLPFTLPAGADSPGRWYVVRLAARIVLSGGDGAATVVASTNDRVVNQVELRRSGAEPKLFYSGYVTGSHTELLREKVTEVSYENYVQIDALRPGANELLLVLDEFAGDLVERVEIDVDETAIIETATHPEQLRLKVPVEPVVIAQGSTRRLPVVLERRGERQDKPASISYSVPDGLVLKGQGRRDLAKVSTGAESYVEVSAPETGNFVVGVAVKGGYNDPSALIPVLVVPAGGNLWRYVVGLGLLLPGALLIFRAVRRTT